MQLLNIVSVSLKLGIIPMSYILMNNDDRVSDVELRDKSQVLNEFNLDTWQRTLFNEFHAVVTSKSRPFPCIFGMNGHNQEQLRFAFVNQMERAVIAPKLSNYIQNARSFGKLTSLVIFEKPSVVQSLDFYHDKFWHILQQLSIEDKKPWPENVSVQIDDASWEFCFSGEPIFVVCNTPAHVARQSRRLSSMTLTFQPRWVFNGILSNPKLAKNATSSVRDRLKPYDFVPPSEALGLYGDSENREAAQYFLSDDDSTYKCPFATLE